LETKIVENIFIIGEMRRKMKKEKEKRRKRFKKKKREDLVV
jgi:hypothetical protein